MTKEDNLLEEAYELINAVYFAHSFDWVLLSQWLDKFNTANGRIPAQYKTNSTPKPDTCFYKRHGWKAENQEEENRHNEHCSTCRNNAKYFVLCLRDGCKEMTSNKSQFCDSHRFFPERDKPETAEIARWLGNAFAVHKISDETSAKSKCLKCAILPNSAPCLDCVEGAESSREPSTPVSPVGKLQEGVNLTEIRSIMTHLEANLWQALDAYTQLQDRIRQNDSVTKGNNQFGTQDAYKWPER